MIAERLHVFKRGSIRRLRNLLHVVEQHALRRRKRGSVEIALGDGLYGLFFGSLNTQEVSMRVQSIRAAVQVRDP
jgi:hypothetical protein